MRRRIRVQMVLLAVIVVLAGAVGVQLATAVPRAEQARPTPAPVDWDAVRAGADASWPACTPPHGTTRTTPLADRPAFVVVGVDDGLPGTTSACIAKELAWAATATGGSSQPRLAYYAMAADPWTAAERRWVPKPFWPSSDVVGGRAVAVPRAFASPAHGTACAGGHEERACAYVYGWAMAEQAAAAPRIPSPVGHRFWIDVEAQATWSDDELFDQAVVEGMAAAFTTPVARGGVGTTTGIYSDHAEWTRIMGRLRTGSPLDDLDEWLAIGPGTAGDAVGALRHDWPMTPGGRIRMVQWLDGRIDRDLAAPAAR
ncbi:hypothetical protein [Amnibacterium kyonggiense]